MLERERVSQLSSALTMASPSAGPAGGASLGRLDTSAVESLSLSPTGRSPHEVDALFLDEAEMAVADAQPPAPEPAEDDSSSEVRSSIRCDRI